MKSSFRSTVSMDGLRLLLGGLLEPADRITAAHAFNIQKNAAQDAPVDTSFLRNSIQAEPVKPAHWWIHDGTEYGVFQELGTRFIAAKYFLTRAVEKEFKPYIDDLKALYQWAVGQ